MTPLLSARGLVKRFPGVIALNGVDFDLRAGEIHALCGENGAGKSTLIKLLAGIHPHGSYEGTLTLDGREAVFHSVRDAGAAGIAVITQELALVDELSVAENIFLGRAPRRGVRVDWLEMHRRAAVLLADFGLSIAPEAPVHTLGIGQKQLIEIVRATDKQSRILVLDEPTAALTEQEVTVLLDHLRRLRAQGTACVYISHKLGEVFAIADRITVLRDGASIVTLDRAAATIPLVIRHMVGREIADLFPKRTALASTSGAPPAAPTVPPTAPLLDVRDLHVARAPGEPAFLRDLSFSLRPGEVLGFGGLMGAGRTELLMHLFGAWGHRISGTVTLRGEPCDRLNPRAAIARGLVLASEDRRRYGLILDQPIGFNLSLSSLRQFVVAPGRIDASAEHVRNQELFDSLRIKAPGQHARAGGLSGGNQQKVVLGKALMTGPAVVMLDEPTRGIDVGAKLEVYELINRLTAGGKAVILVSSELPELMGMSDRIIMLAEGRIGGEFARGEFNQESLLAAAMGHAPAAA
ncbi:sugar ABC transporter ATP-binding protein [Horticoccus sp. 23ND18S-11]|uniref:sugar ABC transporter ATP-binding protein n=1 Tax=Horticoccus sp. 23ND18S-11 TaxID=3391832 RepID=UPI0039C984EA